MSEFVQYALLLQALNNMGYEVVEDVDNLVVFDDVRYPNTFTIDRSVDPIPLDHVLQVLDRAGIDRPMLYQQLDAAG